MNASIQCLKVCDIINKEIYGNINKLNQSNDDNCKILREYFKFVENNEQNAFWANGLYNLVIKKYFNGAQGTQNDSGEFILGFIDSFNECIKKDFTSYIGITYLSCKNTNKHTEKTHAYPIKYIEMDVKNNKTALDILYNLNELANKNNISSIIDDKDCYLDNNKGTRLITYKYYSPILIIHINRIGYDNKKAFKITNKIKIEYELVLNNDDNGIVYKLIGIIRHLGSVQENGKTSGHYDAYVNYKNYNNRYYFNDGNKPVITDKKSLETVMNGDGSISTPYILFYEKIKEIKIVKEEKKKEKEEEKKEETKEEKKNSVEKIIKSLNNDLEKYNVSNYSDSGWKFFGNNNKLNIDKNDNIYIKTLYTPYVDNEENKNLWKVIITADPFELSKILQEIIKICNDKNIQFFGKYINAYSSEKRSLLDCTDLHILFYFYDTKEMKKFVESIGEKLNYEEKCDVNTYKSIREMKINKYSTFIKQLGASFTKQYNNVIFYTQGGFMESSRYEISKDIKFIDNYCDKNKIDDKDCDKIRLRLLKQSYELEYDGKKYYERRGLP